MSKSPTKKLGLISEKRKKQRKPSGETGGGPEASAPTGWGRRGATPKLQRISSKGKIIFIIGRTGNWWPRGEEMGENRDSIKKETRGTNRGRSQKGDRTESL